MRSLKDGVEIVSVVPDSVRVEADRVDVRSVPVEVDRGTVPEGLEIDEPVVSADTAEVRGPASVVSQVDRAVAFVEIPASGINVNEPVPLTLVDIAGQPVGTGQLEVDPEVVSVQIEVRAVETETTVAVRPNIESGTPAPGFALEAIGVDPAYVTIVGLPEVLAEITSVTTEPISIDGLSADETFEVELQLPDDVTLADGEPSSVTVTATIGPSVSSRTFVVGVVCTGAGDNACLPRLDEISITLSGAGEALSALTAADLTPTVDASGLDARKLRSHARGERPARRRAAGRDQSRHRARHDPGAPGAADADPGAVDGGTLRHRRDPRAGRLGHRCRAGAVARSRRRASARRVRIERPPRS